ncbi:uncharacterized protein LOC111026160 [Momordica charantia]|uniref:Uncharacterized protein LOC111026160 n=1 Tax=Momordica charantia TaxID=3673 RepID=A0A6J1E030_MOMCH|nr:uncharacterized protein LOC111026160 [Momordica charantia]XP_022159874.1 uncharacterized protein LOC111026160 [Momordica charantia]XP_022159875.1 uncharacterized protein LOC111026160 [Momordica charantia]XP_022159876.1 uncharacterized protein LOC111026160 [Momordica charantia]
MGFDQSVAEPLDPIDQTHLAWNITVHSLSDLSYISPVVFLYLLKECYVRGTLKATKKFRFLQQQVHLVLHNGPRPGPATFVIHCLYVLPIFGIYSEGFSHLITSALQRFLKVVITSADLDKAKDLAAQLFMDIVEGFIEHDERIIVKILQVFDVQLTNIEKVLHESKAKNRCFSGSAKDFVERYVSELIESQSYVTAVDLLEHFSIYQSGESLLYSMLEKNEFKAADKWATFMGKPMLCLLVQELLDRNKVKSAYGIIKKNDLQKEHPDVYQKCKESSLKKLAEKGCWDVAEAKTNSNRQFLEYLVYLALEAGYFEKVDELCNRYSLTGFSNIKEREKVFGQNHYLNLNQLISGDILWVDKADDLHRAICHIDECKVVGVDCEWKPNHIKGSKPNKVSIMQIASEKMVFVFDLIKLYNDVPDILDNCLTRILQSSSILKLGYNFQCDTKQLSHSYEPLQCFKRYEMLLDIQSVFKEHRGGLSGLAKKILGAGLNKTRRNSDWEQRPLTVNQLEYAALDAVVLVHIFRHVRDQSQSSLTTEGEKRLEWKSFIVSHTDKATKPKPKKKKSKSIKEPEVATNLLGS